MLTDVRGHRLPMRRLGTAASAGRALLVGDAAGLVDPLSGDGMYEAFVSARLAANAILAGDLSGYSAALSRALDHHAAASWAAERAFDRYPRLVFAAARAPGVFNVVAGLLSGDVARPEDASGVARGRSSSLPGWPADVLAGELLCESDVAYTLQARSPSPSRRESASRAPSSPPLL